MKATTDWKVTHVSEQGVRTVQVVRGAAGPWQAIDWLEQRLGVGLRCSAINLQRVAELALQAQERAAAARAVKGGA